LISAKVPVIYSPMVLSAWWIFRAGAGW